MYNVLHTLILLFIMKYKIYKALKVYDGDTILVRNEKGDTANIRFSYIDCFETPKKSSINNYLKESKILISQYRWAEKSKDNLLKMLMLTNFEVKLNIIDYDDFYDRYIAEIYDEFDVLYQHVSLANGTSLILKGSLYKLNHKLLVYLVTSTEKARRSFINLWSDYYALPPYLFRKFKKHIEEYIKLNINLTNLETLKYNLIIKNNKLEKYLSNIDILSKLDYSFQLNTISLLEKLFNSE